MVEYSNGESAPKISVNMIVYNGEAYREEVINSLQMQTFQDLEQIVIDGGSTDSTHEILDAVYADARRSRNEEQRGRLFSRNRTLQHSSTQLIAIFDAAQRLPTGKLVGRILKSEENDHAMRMSFPSNV